MRSKQPARAPASKQPAKTKRAPSTKTAPPTEPERAPVESGDYGVVYVAVGALKGRLVFYDDDGDYGGAICYLGRPLFSDSKTLPFRYLRAATAVEDARFRTEHMSSDDEAARRYAAQAVGDSEELIVRIETVVLAVLQRPAVRAALEAIIRSSSTHRPN